MFNDPNLDQSIIPDDEYQREGLRVGLLVSDWNYAEVESNLMFGTTLDNWKLITYYHTNHGNQSQPLLFCQPLQFVGSPQFYFCTSYTKDDIDRLDNRGSFAYIWKYQREEFLADIVILPLVMLIGIFGEILFISYLFNLIQQQYFLKYCNNYCRLSSLAKFLITMK